MEKQIYIFVQLVRGHFFFADFDRETSDIESSLKKPIVEK